jgi:hypothetical protein
MVCDLEIGAGRKVSKGRKGRIIYQRHPEKLSSLWKREAGRDFGECIFKMSN